MESQPRRGVIVLCGIVMMSEAENLALEKVHGQAGADSNTGSFEYIIACATEPVLHGYGGFESSIAHGGRNR